MSLNKFKHLTPIGNLLRNWRIKHKLNKVNFAYLFNVHPREMEEIMRGIKKLPIGMIEVIEITCKFDRDEMNIVRHATIENKPEGE